MSNAQSIRQRYVWAMQDLNKAELRVANLEAVLRPLVYLPLQDSMAMRTARDDARTLLEKP